MRDLPLPRDRPRPWNLLKVRHRSTLEAGKREGRVVTGNRDRYGEPIEEDDDDDLDCEILDRDRIKAHADEVSRILRESRERRETQR
jgi:hypothetical protein